MRVGRVFFVGVVVETTKREEKEKEKLFFFSKTPSTYRLGGLHARGEGCTHVCGVVGPVCEGGESGERGRKEDAERRTKTQ